MVLRIRLFFYAPDELAIVIKRKVSSYPLFVRSIHFRKKGNTAKKTKLVHNWTYQYEKLSNEIKNESFPFFLCRAN